ncbi:hypothetical protein BOTBODRAFT_327605 [Botryobasidium botryosum FD-172 SS1]|uniref:Uncharacterized protein n=1 Tax=Botryobasidium botryosum (strain FD-172 SS1) TaxID=930990 RepID=A0A067NBA3_BOTB1|nr:hypothetical protein BOTBODRAFT_327605 [Botryobasidium botryosum FD-172 SS1]
MHSDPEHGSLAQQPVADGDREAKGDAPTNPASTTRLHEQNAVQITAQAILDKEVDVLELTMGAVEEEIALQALQAKLSDLRYRRNQLCPIHRLPNEIMSLIFEISVISYHNRCRHVFSIASVSRFWRTIALGTPRIWCRTEWPDYKSEKIVETFLSRSKDVPLHITFNSAVEWFNPTPYFTHVSRHINRWKTCSIWYTDDDENLENITDFLHAPAPILRELYLCRGSPGWDSDADEDFLRDRPLFAGVTPQLCTLSLSGTFIPMDSPIYTGLTSLSLSSIAFGGPRAISQLLSALGGSPGLQVLKLQFLEFSVSFSSTDVLDNRVPAVTLSHLRELNLSGCDVDKLPLQQLLSRITTPPTAEIGLDMNMGPDQSLCDFFPPSLSLPHNLRSLSQTRYLKIDMSWADADEEGDELSEAQEYCALYGKVLGDDEGGFWMETSGSDDHILNVLSNLGKALPMPLLDKLKFACSPFASYRLPAHILKSCLVDYSSLTQLLFRSIHLTSIMEVLTLPSTVPLCPSLQTLAFTDSCFVHDNEARLIDFIKLRATSTNAEGDSYGRATPLKFLRLKNCCCVSPALFQALEVLLTVDITIRPPRSFQCYTGR